MPTLRETASVLDAAADQLRVTDDEMNRLRARADDDAKLIATLRAAAAPVQKPSSMLFWSGFEAGVFIGEPYDCYSAGCWQDILGTDSETGFSWPPAFAASGKFQMRSGADSTPHSISDYIVNDIQTVVGRNGSPTKALHNLIKKNPDTGLGQQGDGAEQDPYLLQPKTQSDLYISFWRKLDPTFLQKMVNTWSVMFEWKTSGDYRVIVNIVTYGGTPYWEIRGDNESNGGLPKQEFWRVNNQTVRVPVGEWFKFEVFWHRSKGTDGRVWMAVNGQKLVDKFAPNIGVNNAQIDRIFLSQLYSGGTYPIEQWTDDVQIWSGFPIAKAGDPWFDGVYGPH